MSQVPRIEAHQQWYFKGIFAGLRLTLMKLFSNLVANFRGRSHRVTLNYPEEKYQYSPRFKGNHVLTVKKDGSLRCTACMLCVTHCPADCIEIVASEHSDSEVEKYPIQYNIDILRCVFCGFCEEACPVDAIRMGPEWQTPSQNKKSFIYDIEHLTRRPSLEGGVPSIVDDRERWQEGL